MRVKKMQEHQKNRQPHIWVKRRVLAAFLTLAILCLFGSIMLFTAPSASAKDIQQLPHEPAKPKVHQVYFNTTDKREYIYNGEEWVPHDASIDTYVLKKYKKHKVSNNSSNGNGLSNTSVPSKNQGAAK